MILATTKYKIENKYQEKKNITWTPFQGFSVPIFNGGHGGSKPSWKIATNKELKDKHKNTIVGGKTNYFAWVNTNKSTYEEKTKEELKAIVMETPIFTEDTKLEWTKHWFGEAIANAVSTLPYTAAGADAADGGGSANDLVPMLSLIHI